MPQLQRNDRILFSSAVLMVFFGLLMVWSASSVMSKLRYEDPMHFVWQQGAALAVALVVMMVLKRTHYRKLQGPHVAFAAIGLVIILLAVVYFVDAKNHRWLRIGAVGLQPAELAKPAIVLFLAWFVTLRARAINHPRTYVPALMAVGGVTMAIAIPDFGTAAVIVITAGAVFFVAGLDRRYFFILIGFALVLAVVAVAAKPYRLNRVIQFYDPQYKVVERIDPHGTIKGYLQRSMTVRDTNYQAEQSKIAVGAGGMSGLGLTHGIQKLFYLPEAHTDFIYAVVCEEMGLAGSLGIVVGFCLIAWRGLRATVHSRDDFARYLALGITTMIVVQAFLNISVVLALVPTKGIPLPMISSGGSSLLSTMSMIGILLNVSENAG